MCEQKAFATFSFLCAFFLSRFSSIPLSPPTHPHIRPPIVFSGRVYSERSIKCQPVYLELLPSLVYVHGIYRRFGPPKTFRAPEIDPPNPTGGSCSPSHQPPKQPYTGRSARPSLGLRVSANVTNLKPCRNLYLFVAYRIYTNTHTHP